MILFPKQLGKNIFHPLVVSKPLPQGLGCAMMSNDFFFLVIHRSVNIERGMGSIPCIDGA